MLVVAFELVVGGNIVSIRGNWEHRRVEAVSRMGEMDRRTFVKLGGASAATLIFGYGPFTDRVWSQPIFSDYPFTLGVASGDPLPDGVVLWTRLAPDPLKGGGMPDKKVPVQWQVATDEGFANVVREGSTFARPELAHSVHVEVGGLNPASEYFYRFRAGSELSPVGKTKTAPAAGSNVAEMAFAFVSCQQYEHGYFTAYRRMAEQEQLDLVVHLGDYIYEYGPNEYVAPGGNVRAHSHARSVARRLPGAAFRQAAGRADLHSGFVRHRGRESRAAAGGHQRCSGYADLRIGHRVRHREGRSPGKGRDEETPQVANRLFAHLEPPGR
ncbi:MAG: alkaline phosphatase D family protein [Rubrobacteraceae bacterium]